MLLPIPVLSEADAFDHTGIWSNTTKSVDNCITTHIHVEGKLSSDNIKFIAVAANVANTDWHTGFQSDPLTHLSDTGFCLKVKANLKQQQQRASLLTSFIIFSHPEIHKNPPHFTIYTQNTEIACVKSSNKDEKMVPRYYIQLILYGFARISIYSPTLHVHIV